MYEIPSLSKRLACLVYELLILLALWLAVGFPFVGLTQGLDPVWVRPLFQGYLLLVTGGYFTWFWTHGGQTLPMKTWRLRLVTQDGASLSYGLAWSRFVLAVAGGLLFGLGFFWALFDRERQFLHDRLLHTRLIAARRLPNKS